MAFGDDGNPSRFLQGQHATDTRELALSIFGGEVLSAFDLATITEDKVSIETLIHAKEARFPKVWQATAEYHSAGKEMLGNNIATGEVKVTLDDILVAHTSLYDLDKMLSHFPIRDKYSAALGKALAKVYDKNNFRNIVRAARTAADGPFPGGTVISDDDLKATASVYNGAAWIEAIKAGRAALYNKDVPEELPLFCTVAQPIFDAIKYAKDTNGQYLLLNRDFGGTESVGKRSEKLEVDSVTVLRTRNMPTTDETADTTVYSKYRKDFSKTLGVLWTPMAVAVARAMAPTMEDERDVRRQEDFLVAKMLSGHDPLRPECAVEFAAVT